MPNLKIMLLVMLQGPNSSLKTWIQVLINKDQLVTQLNITSHHKTCRTCKLARLAHPQSCSPDWAAKEAQLSWQTAQLQISLSEILSLSKQWVVFSPWMKRRHPRTSRHLRSTNATNKSHSVREKIANKMSQKKSIDPELTISNHLKDWP